MKNTIVAIAIALTVCGTLICIAGIGSDTALAIQNSGYVSVKGYAAQKITSDLGIFAVSTLSKNADLKLAYDKLAHDRDLVIGYMNQNGIKAAQIQILPVAIEERFKVNEKGFSTPEVDSFVVSQIFKTESQDVHKIEKLAAGIGDLLGQGIEVKVAEPQYLFTGLESLKLQMIEKATRNAKERADTLARGGKFKLGKVAGIRVGVFQITPAHSTDVEDYGVNDTSSIEKEIKCVVDVQHFVK